MLTLDQDQPVIQATGRRPLAPPASPSDLAPGNRLHSSPAITANSRAYVWPTLLFLGAAFGLATGLGYGSGNHWQYLLHGHHLLDPTFLANDWLTSQTTPHHSAFARALALVGRFIALDTALGWANAMAAIVYVVCVFAIAARYYRSPMVVTALTVLIIALGPLSHIGMSNLLMSYFQPSTIGGVGLLAGLTCLIHGRYRSAGGLFFVTGVFHMSCLVWEILIVGAVTVFLTSTGPSRRGTGRSSIARRFVMWHQETAGTASPASSGKARPTLNPLTTPSRFGLRQALYVFVPIGLAASYHLPFILAMRTPEEAVHAAASARIFQDIYMPGHFRPRTWGLDPFVRFGSLLAAGLVAYAAVGTERRLGRIAPCILGSIAAIVGAGLLLTTAVPVDTVALLFPYRLAPYLILAAQIACAAALTTTAQQPRLSLFKTLLLWGVLAGLLYGGGLRNTYALACVYAPVTALLGIRLAEDRRVPLWIWGIVSLGLLMILAWAGAGRAGVACAGLLLVLGFAVRKTTVQRKRLPIRAVPIYIGMRKRFPLAPPASPDLDAASLCSPPARRRPFSRCALAILDGALARSLHTWRAVLPLLIAAFLMQLGAARKDFLGPPPPADEQDLYRWCQARTARGDVFIIPPSLSGFRLGAERAIVIDARCIAVRSSEIVEWYNRLRAECGADFNSLSEADAGYDAMDAARARAVGRRYGARYVVTRVAEHRGDLSSLRRVHANPTLAVDDLEAGAR